MFVEKLRQSRVIAVDKIRKSRRRMCNKTRRKNVMTEFRCINRNDNTSEAFDYRSSIGGGVMLREQMIGKWSVGDTARLTI